MFAQCAVQLEYAESTRRRISDVRISAERKASDLRTCVPQLKYTEKLTPPMRKSRPTMLRAGERDHKQTSLRKFNEPRQILTRTAKCGSPSVAPPTSNFVFQLENAWSRNGFASSSPLCVCRHRPSKVRAATQVLNKPSVILMLLEGRVPAAHTFRRPIGGPDLHGARV